LLINKKKERKIEIDKFYKKHIKITINF